MLKSLDLSGNVMTWAENPYLGTSNSSTQYSYELDISQNCIHIPWDRLSPALAKAYSRGQKQGEADRPTSAAAPIANAMSLGWVPFLLGFELSRAFTGKGDVKGVHNQRNLELTAPHSTGCASHVGPQTAPTANRTQPTAANATHALLTSTPEPTTLKVAVATDAADSSPSSPTPSSSSSSSGSLAAGVAAAVVIIALICLVAVVVRRRRNRASTGFMPRFVAKDDHNRPLTRRAKALTAELHDLLLHRVQAQFVIGYRQLIPSGVASFEAYQQKIADEIEVGGSAIRVGVEIGAGHYGTVYHGQLKAGKQALPPTKQPHSGEGDRLVKGLVPVAIKVPKLRDDGTGTTHRDVVVQQNAALLLEAFVMHGLRHPHIVSLLAVSARTDPVMLCESSCCLQASHRRTVSGRWHLHYFVEHRPLCTCRAAAAVYRATSVVSLMLLCVSAVPVPKGLEYMENGDLRTFLRKCRPSLKAPKAIIDPLIIAQMAARLSSAMSFLERHRIIHRDVAARNVLVGSTVRSLGVDNGGGGGAHQCGGGGWWGGGWGGHCVTYV